MDLRKLVHLASRLKIKGDMQNVTALLDVNAAMAIPENFIPASEEDIQNFLNDWKLRLENGTFEAYASVVRRWVTLLRNPHTKDWNLTNEFFKSLTEHRLMQILVKYFVDNNLNGWVEPLVCIPKQACFSCGMCCGSMNLGPITEEEAKKLDTIEMSDPQGKVKGKFIKRIRRSWAPWSAGGVCIYLGEDHKCTIYDARPEMCKAWTCIQK